MPDPSFLLLLLLLLSSRVRNVPNDQIKNDAFFSTGEQIVQIIFCFLKIKGLRYDQQQQLLVKRERRKKSLENL